MTGPQGEFLSCRFLADMISVLGEPALVLSLEVPEVLLIAAVNPAFEALIKHSGKSLEGTPFHQVFHIQNQAQVNLQSRPWQEQELTLHVSADYVGFNAHPLQAVLKPYGSAETTCVALLVIKNLDTVAHGVMEADTLVHVLHDFLVSSSFEEAVARFLHFLVHEHQCLQASLWWRAIYAVEDAALTRVATAGHSEMLSASTESLLYGCLIETDSPEPGVVLHDVEKGYVYALPLYVENEVRGALFLVLPPGLAANNLRRYSHFLGQVLGVKLERKFLSQTLMEWITYNPEPTMISDGKGDIYQMNRAMTQLLKGVADDEPVLTKVWELVSPKDIVSFSQLYQALSAGEECFFEGECTYGGDIAKQVLWKMKRSLDNERTFHVIQDASQKYRLTQRLEQVYALAKMGTWELNVEENRAYWSQVTRDIYEIDDPDFQPVPGSGLSYYHGEDRAAITRAVQRCLETGEPWDLELRLITPSGKEKWVRSIGEGEFKAGVCKHLFGVFMDIDDRKRSEIAQHWQTQKLALLNHVHQQFLAKKWHFALPDALQHCIGILRLDFILYLSKMPVYGERVFLPYQVPPPSLNAQEQLLSFLDALAPGSFSTYQVSALPHNHLRAYLKSLSIDSLSLLPVFSGGLVQGVIVMGNGHGEDNLSFIQTFAYGLSQAMANQTSVERLQQLNAELAEHMNALAYSNQELEQFAYIASHDLQEPLRMVTSFLNQLEKKYSDVLDEKAHRYIYFATDGARRMRQIILDLLEYSRLGKPEQMVYESISSDGLKAELNMLLSKKITDTAAEITWDFPSDFAAPRVPLRQVLQNLIENALKYMNPDKPPQIHLVLRPEAENWVFSVQDNGIGIEKEYFEKIFVIFQRLHGKERYEGTGVGLALCKKIVEQCQGKIWVESSPGVGSTFYFKIPRGETV